MNVKDCLISFSIDVEREFVRSECEHLLELSCELLNFGYGEVLRDIHGKPYIESQNFFFSFSHSRNVACCAVHEYRRVGIDLQFESEKLLHIKKRFLNDEDFLFDNSLEELCRVWCIKEAVFKASAQHLVSLKNIFIKDRDIAQDINGERYFLFCSRFEDFHFALAINL